MIIKTRRSIIVILIFFNFCIFYGKATTYLLLLDKMVLILFDYYSKGSMTVFLPKVNAMYAIVIHNMVLINGPYIFSKMKIDLKTELEIM